MFLPMQRPDKQTMGQMASGLEDMFRAKKKPERLPRENTVRLLKDFTSFDRNPLIHKTVMLDDADASTLFNNAASLITEMCKEIKAVETVANAPLVAAFPNPFASAEEEPAS